MSTTSMPPQSGAVPAPGEVPGAVPGTESGTEPVEAPARPRSPYSLGSTPNMLRSLLVILGLVGVLLAIVPRVGKVEQPAVDAVSVVTNAVRESGLPYEAPVGLPAGWKATNARYGTSTDGLLTWQAGWATPKGGYVAIRQTRAASPSWVKAATNDGVSQGTVDAAGRTWQKMYDSAHDQTSLVNQPSGQAAGVATVVAATAQLDEVLVFTNALQPARPR